MTVKGSNRVRGCKNYIHPPLTETGNASNYGGASNGLSDCDKKSQHIFRDSPIDKENKTKRVSKTTGGASFKRATTSKTIKGKD